MSILVVHLPNPASLHCQFRSPRPVLKAINHPAFHRIRHVPPAQASRLRGLLSLPAVCSDSQGCLPRTPCVTPSLESSYHVTHRLPRPRHPGTPVGLTSPMPESKGQSADWCASFSAHRLEEHLGALVQGMPADCATWSSQQSVAFVDAALEQIKEEITLGLHQASTHGIIHNVLMRSQDGNQPTENALRTLLYQALQKAQEQQVLRGVTHDAVYTTSQSEQPTSDVPSANMRTPSSAAGSEVVATGPQTENLSAPPNNYSHSSQVGATPALCAEELSHSPARVTHNYDTCGGKETSVQQVREDCRSSTSGNQCISITVWKAAVYHCTVGSPCLQWSTPPMLCTIQRGAYIPKTVSTGKRQITLCVGTIHQPCSDLNAEALAQAHLKPLPSSVYSACYMSILFSVSGSTRGVALRRTG